MECIDIPSIADGSSEKYIEDVSPTSALPMKQKIKIECDDEFEHRKNFATAGSEPKIVVHGVNEEDGIEGIYLKQEPEDHEEDNQLVNEETVTKEEPKEIPEVAADFCEYVYTDSSSHVSSDVISNLETGSMRKEEFGDAPGKPTSLPCSSTSLLETILSEGKRQNTKEMRNVPRRPLPYEKKKEPSQSLLERILLSRAKRGRPKNSSIEPNKNSVKGNTTLRSKKEKKAKNAAEKKFTCTDCSFESKYKASLINHMLTHTNIKLVKCPYCDYECNWKGYMKQHMLIHSHEKRFKCASCSYSCNFKSSLKDHMLTHSDTPVEFHKCSICDAQFLKKPKLKMHMRTHLDTKLFKCSSCNYECNLKENLRRHMLTHSDTKLFKCTLCTYECNRKDMLRSHSLTHSGIKMFQCPECDYKCNVKSSLKIHMLKHSNVNLFECSNCSYKCKRKVHLKQHLLTHLDVKLFKCHDCSYECNQKINLKKHMESHHGEKNKWTKKKGAVELQDDE